MQKGRALPPIPQQSSSDSLVDAIGNYHNWTLLPLVEREHLRQGEYIRRGEA
ncbi:hypothetical protein [Microcoleus sp. PH2017_32_RDM_D_A]|uniref:hypothetical protein n=1 Tax=Microcoleus sp. PH2017_32_RDM_D_A TaxID=2798842 RepID=UPI001DC04FE2|nr:hypothetical protein [Microcoleus sp. PH2017_32_RDM_D_A]MCC3580659.1 hypothetical protein [Microcoleus sp. PH2017_32_RDM_D_A]